MRYINYHKHTHYSNVRTLDCIVKPEDYCKRAVELGHTEYVTTEHGFQGNLYEAQTLCEKYGLRCIYGVEAYYVDDMILKEDRTNYHIMLIGMTKKARFEINSILSKANTAGFYYKPRIDLNCLLSLTPTDTIVTTACVAGRMFKDGWEDKFLKPVLAHFQGNFYLEVQCHDEEIQKVYNKNLIEVSKKYGIGLIHANDSHYILPEDAEYRDLFLKAKGISYEDESNFILDYPDYETIVDRYHKQGILTDDQITEALRNTLIFDNAEVVYTDKEFKIPKVIDGDSDEYLKNYLTKMWSREKANVKAKRIPKYEEAIYYEYNIIKNCGMADYFILNNIIVNRAVNDYGAVLTKSGRGSAVSFYINKLLGLTEIDRIKAPITLYPTRFMSAERILQSRSLPDIDLNFADVTPVIQASKDILGKDGIYYMICYKPLQNSSAFRLWCKAIGMDINEYDEVAKDLGEYKKEYEGIYSKDEKWATLIDQSKVFRGVIESVAPSPCSFLLSNNPISKEVGLIKVGDIMCCAIDGYNCDVYKYLKNDYLTVTVYDIIDKVYKLIGRPIDDISTLVNNCDDKVWDLYANGITTTINQADSDFDKQILKEYKPRNLAEMSAYVAAIRPGFASLLKTFTTRQEYSTGVPKLDELLEDSFHFLMYQESIMKFLVWLGIEEKGTYDIIKKISKKKFKEEELKELKETLKVGWIKNVGSDNHFEETWQVVNDAAKYSFNASHSLSVAIDSLYGAYLKSHYPLEYFTVALSVYSGDMDRTSKLTAELSYFNIKINPIKFGHSLSEYTMDKSTNSIYKGISSIKYCNSQIANDLMELSKNNYATFIDLLTDISTKTSVNSRQLNILTGLNFFSDFGKNKYLLEIIDIYNKFNGKKQIRKTNLFKLGLTFEQMQKYSKKETEALFKEIDTKGLIKELCNNLQNKELSIQEMVKFEMQYLEYTTYSNPKVNKNFYIIVNFKIYKDKTKPYLVIRCIKTGEEIKTKITRGKTFSENPFKCFSVIKVDNFKEQNKKKCVNGVWVETNEKEKIITDWTVIKN